MKPLTYKEQLIKGLQNMGWTVDSTSKSEKYVAFKKEGVPNKIFVGKFGALRWGRCASASHSIGDPQSKTSKYLAVLKAAETQPNLPNNENTTTSPDQAQA